MYIVELSLITYNLSLENKIMECHFNFNKKTITTTVGDFLCENLPSDIDHIKRNICQQKK